VESCRTGLPPWPMNWRNHLILGGGGNRRLTRGSVAGCWERWVRPAWGAQFHRWRFFWCVPGDFEVVFLGCCSFADEPSNGHRFF